MTDTNETANTIVSDAEQTWIIKALNNFDLSSGVWMGILTTLMIVFMLTNYILPVAYSKVTYATLSPVFNDAVGLYKWILGFFAGTKIIYGTHNLIRDVKLNQNGGK